MLIAKNGRRNFVFSTHAKKWERETKLASRIFHFCDYLHVKNANLLRCVGVKCCVKPRMDAKLDPWSLTGFSFILHAFWETMVVCNSKLIRKLFTSELSWVCRASSSTANSTQGFTSSRIQIDFFFVFCVSAIRDYTKWMEKRNRLGGVLSAYMRTLVCFHIGFLLVFCKLPRLICAECDRILKFEAQNVMLFVWASRRYSLFLLLRSTGEQQKKLGK